MDSDRTNRILQISESHASYSVIVIEIFNAKIVNAIYSIKALRYVIFNKKTLKFTIVGYFEPYYLNFLTFQWNNI